MAEEKTFYVGIGNKSDVRRSILECSKDIVTVLKDYEKLNSIREEKIEKIMELKNVLADLKQLGGLLKEQFPAEKMGKVQAAKPITKVEKKIVKKIVTRVPVKVKKPSNEIKKLEEELGEIEARLSKMGV